MELKFKGGVIELERALKKVIYSATTVAIPKVPRRVKKKTWWDKQVDDMKSRVVALKSRLRVIGNVRWR